MKKSLRLFIALALLISCTGCAGNPTTSLKKFQHEYFDLFDTVTVVIGYSKSEKEFDKYADVIYDEMLRIHKLTDIYNNYEGINNLKTVNDKAGISAVEVNPTIIDLLTLAKTSYEKTGGAVNAAMGGILRLWHYYRSQGAADPELAELPPGEALEEAADHISFSDVEIDEAAGTVFLKDPQMSLDVGALAKGYAVQRAIDKVEAAGMESGFISAGGNVRAIGKPMDGRDTWAIGIKNPDTSDSAKPLFDTVNVTEAAVVTSGDYERFYVVDGVKYPHIIDPETGYPAKRYKSVTIIIGDSGIADMLSTALFILPYEKGLELAVEYGAEALWIYPDGSLEMTDGYKAVSKQFGPE